jgi:hypothetical protein
LGNQECPILGEGRLVDAAHTGDDDLFADVSLSITQTGPSFPHRRTYLRPTSPEMPPKMKQSRNQDVSDEELVRLCQEMTEIKEEAQC